MLLPLCRMAYSAHACLSEGVVNRDMKDFLHHIQNKAGLAIKKEEIIAHDGALISTANVGQASCEIIGQVSFGQAWWQLSISFQLFLQAWWQ